MARDIKGVAVRSLLEVLKERHGPGIQDEILEGMEDTYRQHLRGHRRGIVVGAEEAGDALAHHLGQAAHVGSDHRDPR